MTGDDPATRRSGEAAITEWAVVEASWVAVRAEPDHRSEMVSQWVCGETLAAVGREGGWLRTRGPDGYEGWCSGGGLHPCDRATARLWREAASARSLGVRIGDARHAGTWLPFGARVVAGDEGVLRLPLQRRVPDPGEGAIVTEEARRRRFPARGDAVTGTVGLWRGTPYLWGGRTPHGADCSGFVQAAFAMHGIELPRDSGSQMEGTPPVEAAVREPEARRPSDLLFFRAADGDAVAHVAVSLGGTRIAHVADPRGGFALDDLSDPPEELTGLDRRLVGVGRPVDSPPEAASVAGS